jgi:hypothetical protein
MCATITSSLRRDANAVPLQDVNGITVIKSMTFAGGTTNDPGDYDGTGNPATLFTVTGDVILRVFGICKVDLAGATATLEVGVTGTTNKFIAQTTATGIDANKIWHDNSPDASIELDSVSTPWIVSNGQDVIQTVGTANITAGRIDYYCQFRPLSSDGDVTAT